MDQVGDRMLATLRKLAPSKVRVYDAQDDARDIAVPTRRKKWSQVVATIEARPWVRAELLDRAGAVLGYVENDGAADELEDISASVPQGAAQSRWFLEMMIKAQTVALSYRDKEHTTLLQSMREMMEVQMHSTRDMIALLRAQRDEGMELAAIRAAAESSDGIDGIVKLVEASPKLMGVLGPIVAALAPRRLPQAQRPAAPPAAADGKAKK